MHISPRPQHSHDIYLVVQGLAGLPHHNLLSLLWTACPCPLSWPNPVDAEAFEVTSMDDIQRDLLSRVVCFCGFVELGNEIAVQVVVVPDAEKDCKC